MAVYGWDNRYVSNIFDVRIVFEFVMSLFDHHDGDTINVLDNDCI